MTPYNERLRQERDRQRLLIADGIDPVDQRKLERSQRRLDTAQAEQRHKEELARIEVEKALTRTFHESVQKWAVQALAHRSDQGAESLRAIHKDITPALGNIPLADITRASIVDQLDQVVQRGSKVMANHLFADLRQFFNFAVTREWIAVSPLAGVKRSQIGGKPVERDRVLSAPEIVELSEKLPTAKLQQTTICAIWIMLATGCRVGELTQTRWTEVNFEGQEWVIPPSKTKNGKEHRIFISPFTADQFKRLNALTSAYSEWCFPARDPANHANLKSISKQIKDRTRTEVLKKRSNAAGTLLLGGGAWTPHDLRRTAATTMAELGIVSDIIKRCLNQSDDDKLKRIYQRYEFTEEKRNAWMLLGEHLNNVFPCKGKINRLES